MPLTREFQSRGGTAFKEKFGDKGFQSLVSKRWHRHFGRMCLNCDKMREDIEKDNLPCEKEIYVMVKKVESFPEGHVYNDPKKGKPTSRNPKKNQNRKKKQK